ncbi:MAG TPA: hypothetical protein VH253_00155 [Phycisphaerae bacterium]|nr:hypothetical protein [Phycisphaerae bacterium]
MAWGQAALSAEAGPVKMMSEEDLKRMCVLLGAAPELKRPAYNG